MNVLSLFDGMSCGQIALDRLGVRVDQYFAAEIDKYAIQVAKKNYPNTQHIGNVLDVKGEDLPKIDLLIGGSPCQGFSFAGKQLNFDDPRSKLFFEFVRLLKETKPKYFLLENVRMKKEYQDVISEHLGVEPVMICSSLVSAQSRKRLYWTNIPGLIQPEDKGIVLKDILEDLPIEKELAPYMTGEFDGVSRLDKGIFTFTDKDKSAAQTGSGGHANKYLIHRPCELQDDGSLIVPEATKKGHTIIQPGDCFDLTFPNSKTRRGRNMKDKSNCLTAANYDYMVLDGPYPMQFKAKNKKNVIINESDLDAPRTVYEARTELGKQTRREIKKLTGKDSTKRSPEHKQYQVQKHQKANCLVTVDSELNKVIDKKLVYRKLTPVECMRLQTVDDDYFDDTGISNTQRYKLLGNGWTVDVICHLLKGIKAEFARKVA